ncbi:hypothetical protein FRC09_006801 [Ceratobasidium sp. 395]|nr:hypothetical protein FRC09_006801 [Ceratobasidium sp. 395]
MPPKTFISPYLEVLSNAVSRLPETVPSASIDNPVYQCFHNPVTRPNERLFQTFERAYTECFHPGPEGGLTCLDNVARGEHGIVLVISYLEANAKHPKMNSNELRRTGAMVQKLVDLVHQRPEAIQRAKERLMSLASNSIHEAPKPIRVNSGGRKANRKDKASTSDTVPATKRSCASNLHDADYTPGTDPDSSGEELDVEAENELGILSFGMAAGKERQVDPSEKESRPGGTNAPNSSDSEAADTVPAAPKPGRVSEKGNWAMEQFDKTPTASVRPNGEPRWTFKCKWCCCTMWDRETAEMKAFSRSNFIYHAERCKQLPADHRYKAAGTDDTDVVNQSGAPSLSQREFSSALAKAVVRDNYAMTFGEGDGMIQLFNLILPSIRLPSHQTLQRHLYHLFDALSEKVKTDLKVVEHHAISTDAWTSKNSVYALAGVVLFFIDDTWRLHELVLDVVDLDAEHSGNHLGRLLYKSLKSKETAHRAIACVTDNAKNNAVMNRTLAQQIQDNEHTHVHGEGMAFTCVNHGFHLVCTDIFSNMGLVEPGDYYSDVKGSEIEFEHESKGDTMEGLTDVELALGSDSDDDDDVGLLRLGLAPDTSQKNTADATQKKGDKSSQSRWAKILNVAEKVHEIVVYVSASPKRRKEFHIVIKSTCPKEKAHLFVIQSMRMRWGSAYLESKRAIELRPAFTHFVANLDSNRSRSLTLERARELQERWTIQSEEWDLLNMLVEVLSPFYAATEAMSRKDVATLADVFPTFALLERKLDENITTLRHRPDGQGKNTARALLAGLEAGLTKLRKYQTLAHESDLCLMATVLNPRLRLKYLERWPGVHARAKTLFEYIFESYRAGSSDISGTLVTANKSASKSHPKPATSWNHEIYADVPSFVQHFDQEIYEYFGGSYPCPPEMDTLGWWKVFNLHFPTIAKMARDFLCIPATSVSVERLFSQCKLTMTDIRSSMSFETARRRICCQHWMKAGVDMDVVRKALDIKSEN